MSNDTLLRQHLVELLRSNSAHAPFDAVLDGFPVEKAGIRPHGFVHSAWQLLEHLRIAQNDILLFTKSADHPHLKWPQEYWPPSESPLGAAEWHSAVRAFNEDLSEFQELICDAKRDLNAPFPWGDGQTLLREALLLADHNAYHLGQLMLVRRALELA